MALAEDLLEQAKHLASREKKKPRQASLRRSVSTSYYALFHLLIHEATLNWKRAGHRPLIARLFEHGKMKAASDKQRVACSQFLKSNPAGTADVDVMSHLRTVAEAFVQAQQRRHSADYDNLKQWTRTEALGQWTTVNQAFQSWRAIRKEDAAQDFLVSLLGSSRF